MPNRRSASVHWLIVALLLAAGAGASGPVAAQSVPIASLTPPSVPALGYAPGVVLVGLDSGVTLSVKSNGAPAVAAAQPELAQSFTALDVRSAANVFSATGGRATALAGIDQPIRLDRVYRLRLPPGESVTRAVEILAATPGVLFAEPDYTAQLAAVPNDPLYAGQWGLDQIGAEAAWDVVTGTTSTTIAVIDSGLDTTHPDLTGQLWTNPGETPGNSLDDDNNGYTDDVNGWNVFNNNANLSDVTGHGTQVAGVIAARTNNGVGVAGVCWTCRLMVVKVTNSGTANYSDIAAGVNYAVNKGARVINLSLGGNSDSVTLRLAIAAAVDQAVVVGGAGNDNSSALFYPAAYPGVLAVAGTDQADTRVSTSNFGPWVDLAAPGEAITTTFSGGGYGSSSGTSLAAPFAAGVAGLLRSQNPAWTAAQTQAQLIHTALALADPDLGAGRLDADAAVNTPDEPALSVAAFSVDGVVGGHPSPGSTVELLVTLYNDWGAATNVQATLTDGSPHVTINTASANYGDLPTYGSQANTSAFAFALGGGAGLGANLLFTLTLTGDGGFNAVVPVMLTTELATVNVSGSLNTQTWDAAHVYVLTGNATVGAGQVLTIEPGTTVRFGLNRGLSVAGTLIADAEGGEPILFVRHGITSTWNRLFFQDSSQDAAFDGGGNYTGGSIVRNVIFDEHSTNGIELDDAAPFIADSHFSSGGISGAGDPANTLIVSGNVLTGSQIYLRDVGQILSNTVSSFFGVGIHLIDNTTPTLIMGNRVLDNVMGMAVSQSMVVHNLFSGNEAGLKIEHDNVSVVSNTVAYNDLGIQAWHAPPAFYGNNLVGADTFDLVNYATDDITAGGNWWGTTSAAAIEDAIYDLDDGGTNLVDYTGFLSGPSQDAPAYVTGVTVAPDSVLGIQTGTFDVSFSRPMNELSNPNLAFHVTSRDTFAYFPYPGQGSVIDVINVVAIDAAGVKWFGNGRGLLRLENNSWTQYTSANSELPSGSILDLAVAADNSLWIVTNERLAHLANGVWTIYTTENSPGFPGDLRKVDIDPSGIVWVGADRWHGLGRFDGVTWTTYDAENSAVEIYSVIDMAVDQLGDVLVAYIDNESGFGQKLARFDGTTFTNLDLPDDKYLPHHVTVAPDNTFWVAAHGSVHDRLWRVEGDTWTSSEDLNAPDEPFDYINGMTVAPDGTVWFVENESGLLYRYRNGVWSSYQPSLTSVLSNVTLDPTGSPWIGSQGQVGRLAQGLDYHLDTGVWLDDHTYRATHDFTALVPRDTYSLTITGAAGPDGVEIAPDQSLTFTVDYAGAITDQSAPSAPNVFATGDDGDDSAASASWTSRDSESDITGYRYAIGTTDGGADIVNWTTTASPTAARAGLGLVPGQTYWVSVQSQNESGLWSPIASDWFIAGETKVARIYLPLIAR